MQPSVSLFLESPAREAIIHLCESALRVSFSEQWVAVGIMGISIEIYALPEEVKYHRQHLDSIGAMPLGTIDDMDFSKFQTGVDISSSIQSAFLPCLEPLALSLAEFLSTELRIRCLVLLEQGDCPFAEFESGQLGKVYHEAKQYFSGKIWQPQFLSSLHEHEP